MFPHIRISISMQIIDTSYASLLQHCKGIEPKIFRSQLSALHKKQNIPNEVLTYVPELD